MIPLSLTLTNFMSYREPVTIDFDGVRLACLSGRNGAGKSALLDAMTWALWGKTRGKSDRDVISIGADFMEVTFEFRISDREYQVFRRRTSGNRPTLHFFSRQAGSPDFGMVSGDSIRETQDRVSNTLKIDYDTFIHSAFLMQGKADSFTEMRPGERKQVLGDILNLGDYDQLARMARQQRTAANTRVDMLRERLDQADTKLERRPELERQQEQFRDELASVDSWLDTNRTTLRTLASQLQTFQVIIENRDRSTERLTRATANQKQVANELAANQALHSSISGQLNRESEIREAAAAFQRWRAVADECANVLTIRRPLEERLAEARRDRERQQHQLNREIDRATDRLTSLEKEQQGVARDAQRLQELEREAEVARITIAGLTAELAREEALTEQRVELQARNSRLKDDADQIKANIATLNKGEAFCPVCRKPLEQGEHQHIEEEWDRDLASARDAYRSNAQTLAQLNTVVAGLREMRKEYDRHQTKQSERLAAVMQLRASVQRKAELDDEGKQATAALTTLQATNAQQSFALSERKVIAALLDELEEHSYDANLHEEARRMVKELEQAEAELSQLEQARVRFENLTSQIADLEKRLEHIVVDIEQEQLVIQQFTEKLSQEPVVRNTHATLQTEIAETEKRQATLQSNIGALASQLAELDSLAEQRKDLLEQRKETAKRVDALDELSTAFGINGIQAMVIENILPELADDANALLRRMAAGHLQVSFHTAKQAVSNDNVIETLDIIIRDEAGERPYDLYSGGEAFRINFAIRIALSKLLARRAGATIDLLIIDEGFGTQDNQGRDGLVEALNSIQDYFETILVITHIEEIRDRFETRIDVMKSPSGSQVSIN